MSPPRGLLEKKAGLGASFRRSTIRDGYRQSALFDSIVSWSSLPLRQMLEDTTMSLSEQSSERKLRIPAPSETTLLATIAICFLVLHILAAAMLTSTRQNDAVAAPEPPGLSSGD
ncbi:hypothetical protein XH79_18725 [Bradyrhizobium sp. CCBAU 45389]|nr:hypothetical protein [Bradyrhizobium sp. CCBAU 45389]